MENVYYKKRNRGVTLIELVVVIAIMAVLASFSFYCISMITGQKGKDAATKIDNVFNKTRTASLTKAGEHYVSIYMGDGGEIIIESSDEGTLTAGKSGVRVTYQLLGSEEEKELGGRDDMITFRYKQNSASFSGLLYDNIKIYANSYYWMIKFYKTTGKTEVTKVHTGA